jgi:hypothetical protein
MFLLKRAVFGPLLAVALLALGAVAAGAEELTVHSILAAHQSGASPHGIITMVNNPSNTITMTAGDIVTLRNAGVSESVIAAIWVRIPAPTPAQVPLQPDDGRLVDLVRLINSGMSDSIIAEQVRQSGQTYNLSVNDLLYLKQNGVQESTIAALMATPAGAPAAAPATAPATAPAELVFNDLVLVKSKLLFLNNHREGRLVMQGNGLTWVDARDPKQNFTFQTTGLKKVWYTCEARTPEDFCHQINFQIEQGDRYQFQDSGRESGSNAAVLKVMEALRRYFPTLAFGAPDS